MRNEDKETKRLLTVLLTMHFGKATGAIITSGLLVILNPLLGFNINHCAVLLISYIIGMTLIIILNKNNKLFEYEESESTNKLYRFWDNQTVGTIVYVGLHMLALIFYVCFICAKMTPLRLGFIIGITIIESIIFNITDNYANNIMRKFYKPTVYESIID